MLRELPDGTREEIVGFSDELTENTSNLTLTLQGASTSCEVPDWCRLVGMKASATGIRVRLNAVPEAKGAKTGNAVVADAKKGAVVSNEQMLYSSLPVKTGRVLHFAGAGNVEIDFR